MKKSTLMVVAAVSVPVMAATTGGAALAAPNPATVIITEMEGLYRGPLSSAGKIPKITIEATEVSRAFTKMTNVKTVRKVAKGTDGEANEEGAVVKVEGYRCKAKSIKTINPGTAGMYEKVKWKCTFRAADTPTEITLRYKQSSL